MKRHMVKELNTTYSPELDLIQYGVAPILAGKVEDGYSYIFDTMINPVQSDMMTEFLLQKMEEYARKFYQPSLM